MSYSQTPESVQYRRDKASVYLAEIARHLYSIQADLPVVIHSGVVVDVITQTDIEYLTTLLQVTHKAHEKVCEMLGQLG